MPGCVAFRWWWWCGTAVAWCRLAEQPSSPYLRGRCPYPQPVCVESYVVNAARTFPTNPHNTLAKVVACIVAGKQRTNLLVSYFASRSCLSHLALRNRPRQDSAIHLRSFQQALDFPRCSTNSPPWRIPSMASPTDTSQYVMDIYRNVPLRFVNCFQTPGRQNPLPP